MIQIEIMQFGYKDMPVDIKMSVNMLGSLFDQGMEETDLYNAHLAYLDGLIRAYGFNPNYLDFTN